MNDLREGHSHMRKDWVVGVLEVEALQHSEPLLLEASGTTLAASRKVTRQQKAGTIGTTSLESLIHGRQGLVLSSTLTCSCKYSFPFAKIGRKTFKQIEFCKTGRARRVNIQSRADILTP
jgi:hypothetical protein